MARSRRSYSLRVSLHVSVLVASLGACGGGESAPPKVASHAPSSDPALPQEVASPVTGVDAGKSTKNSVAAEPTTLTDEQKKRDGELAAKLAPYVDAYSNTDPYLSIDRKAVLFLSNRDGLRQAYLGDPKKPGAEPAKLTTGTERVSDAMFTRDGKFVLFRGDEGADENFRIFRIGLDGTGLKNLTPTGKLHCESPVLPRLRPNVMLYSARDVSESKTHCFAQDISGTEPREFYVDPQPGALIGATPDGAQALFIRERSASDLVLFRVDTDGGKATQVYPPPNKTAGITDAAYSADGKRVFVATDEGGQSSSVLMLEPTANSGVLSARYKEETPASASIQSIVVSPKDDRIAISVDAGNHSEVRILDAKTLKLVTTVKTPLGVAFAQAFSADGKVLTLRAGAADKPNDIYEVDAATGTVKALRADVRPGLKDISPMDTSIERVVAFDGLTLPVNLYLPKARAGAKLPVIVSVHGGPSASSTVGWNPLNRFFVAQGYAVVEPNLRGSTGFGRAYEMADNRAKRGDVLKDLETLNAWVKGQPWADRDRVVVFGGSYGGYIVLMALSRQPALWRAGIDLVGVANLTSFLKSTSQDIRSAFVDEFGDLDKDADLLAQYSPIRDVAKITAPLFVYQGQNDPRVPRSESDLIVTALRERNIPVEYMVIANEGHSLDRRETRIAFLARTSRFLADQMKPLAK